MRPISQGPSVKDINPSAYWRAALGCEVSETDILSGSLSQTARSLRAISDGGAIPDLSEAFGDFPSIGTAKPVPSEFIAKMLGAALTESITSQLLDSVAPSARKSGDVAEGVVAILGDSGDIRIACEKLGFHGATEVLSGIRDLHAMPDFYIVNTSGDECSIRIDLEDPDDISTLLEDFILTTARESASGRGPASAGTGLEAVITALTREELYRLNGVLEALQKKRQGSPELRLDQAIENLPFKRSLIGSIMDRFEETLNIRLRAMGFRREGQSYVARYNEIRNLRQALFLLSGNDEFLMPSLFARAFMSQVIVTVAVSPTQGFPTIYLASGKNSHATSAERDANLVFLLPSCPPLQAAGEDWVILNDLSTEQCDFMREEFENLFGHFETEEYV